jgi:hypothetical protein
VFLVKNKVSEFKLLNTPAAWRALPECKNPKTGKNHVSVNFERKIPG